MIDYLLCAFGLIFFGVICYFLKTSEPVPERPKIFIINGAGGSGKDTFVKLCAKYCYVKHYSTIDITKHALKSVGLYNGTYNSSLGMWFEENKSPEVRKLLSDVKRAIDQNTLNESICKIIRHIDRIIKSDGLVTPDIIFICSREQHEIDYIKSAYNYRPKTLLIDKKVELCETEKSKETYKKSYDITISNNGSIETLEQKVKTFIFDQGIKINENI